VLISIHRELRLDAATVHELVVAGFSGVDPTGVEVHVDPATRRQASFTGRAYPHRPVRPTCHPDTRFLVRLTLPAVLRNRGYPLTYRYRGLRTAPWITVEDWAERLVALAAHEAFHVHQFRDRLRRSEVQAERWSLNVLAGWRFGRTAPTEWVTGFGASGVTVARVARPRTRRRPERGTQLTLPGVA
jgi:hypothetical protein